MHIAELPDEVTYSLYAAAVGAAVLRGGWAERTLAVLIAWQAVNGFILPLRWTLGWPTDVVTFGVCVALVLRSHRYWTTWAAASALLMLVTDVLRVAADLTPWSYASAKLTWSYAMTVSLLIGALRPARAQAE